MRLGIGRAHERSTDHPLSSSQLASAFASIGIDRDYSTTDVTGLQVDVRGWGSDEPMFERVLTEARPHVVFELGTWKGASLLHMRDITLALGLDTQFVCVDTWLGSANVWISPKYRPDLALDHGYPTLYRQFVRNLIAADAVADVFPLPMTTTVAAGVLAHLGVVADVVYVDAGHQEAEVRADLQQYFALLRPGGIMFGDDYHPSVPGVIPAVDSFAGSECIPLELDAKKWLFRKPA
jgi:hypothetical protein